MSQFKKTGTIKVAGFDLEPSDLTVTRQFSGDDTRYANMDSEDGSMVIALDLEEDETTTWQWLGREMMSAVQKLRKNGNLTVGDEIEVFFSEEGGKCFQHALSRGDISNAVKFKLGTSPLPMSMMPPWATVVASSTATVRAPSIVYTTLIYFFFDFFLLKFFLSPILITSLFLSPLYNLMLDNTDPYFNVNCEHHPAYH